MTAHRSVAATLSQPPPDAAVRADHGECRRRTCRDAERVRGTYRFALASGLAHDNGTGLIGYRHHLLGLVRKKLVNRLLGAAAPGQARVVMHDQESAGH